MFIRLLEFMPALLDLPRFSIDLISDLRCDLKAVQASDRFLRTFDPQADRAAIGQFTGVLEVLGELLILLDIRTRWQGKWV
jgi:hypothetical protein